LEDEQVVCINRRKEIEKRKLTLMFLPDVKALSPQYWFPGLTGLPVLCK
jgi:hypothetical protein